MKQVLRTAGGRAAVLLGISLAGSGCTEVETGFFILGNVSTEPPDCVADPESSNVLRGEGVLDVSLRPDYVATLKVGSQLAPRGDKTNLRTETMIATFSGAEVRLTGDNAEPVAFTVPAVGTSIPPDTSADPSFGIVSATLIPAALGIEIAAGITSRGEVRTRIAQVRVFGETLGGLEIETGPFDYPIRVCSGCLVDFPADALVEGVDGGPVCGGSVDDAPEAPCRMGQDDVVDCRLCLTNPACVLP